MKNRITSAALFFSRIDRQHIQLILALLAMAMLILGVGSPTDAGGGGPH